MCGRGSTSGRDHGKGSSDYRREACAVVVLVMAISLTREHQPRSTSLSVCPSPTLILLPKLTRRRAFSIRTATVDLHSAPATIPAHFSRCVPETILYLEAPELNACSDSGGEKAWLFSGARSNYESGPYQRCVSSDCCGDMLCSASSLQHQFLKEDLGHKILSFNMFRTLGLTILQH